MYLEKLEIQGFKSFANKNVLKFSVSEKETKHGITAVVGPNGSGKSNIADAVRWVLGEQSIKLLRGKKSEDVIFSGSSKKSSLSFAEVSLYLNNECPAKGGHGKKAPIDYSEIVITRRLYRDGESEYLLNGSKVRLLDISLLLAKAHFGQRAYSVIGQGMVENFLNTSITERKEFFDEATGVKMYQIKRDDATNKLRGTRENLDQAENLLAEIEPRMRSLTRQIKKLEQRTELETELHKLQINYYASSWHKLNNELKEINKNLIGEEQGQREKEKELNNINQKIEELQSIQYGSPNKSALEEEKELLEEKRNKLNQELAEVKAKINITHESAGNIDLVWLERRLGQLQSDVQNENKKITAKIKEIGELDNGLEKIKKQQAEVNSNLEELKNKLAKTQGHDGSQDNKISRIKNYIEELYKINQDIFKSLESEIDISKIKAFFNKLKDKIEQLKKEASNDKDVGKEIYNVNQGIAELEEKRNNLTQEYIDASSRLNSSRSEKVYMENLINSKEKEIAEIEKKLTANKKGGNDNVKELASAQQELEAEMKKINEQLNKVKASIEKEEEAGRESREKIMGLQSRSHELQLGFNDINNKINEIKINKARVETKIEDLEHEIRQELNDLRAVIDAKPGNENIDKNSAYERIQKLKNQLEQIGGIDPEIKKEYDETKTRFEFLSNQVEDLQSGMKSLDKIINELDKTIADKFDTAFNQIAKQFEKYFKVLFNGGSSKLVKYMSSPAELERDEENAGKDDESAQSFGGADKDEHESKEEKKDKGIILRKKKEILAGIEIQATPPGKKIKSISMLSGGERALTAIALICAIISVNPSPFVVLDEVDAALDEANSGRLGRILEELSSKTQFITITHNRGMMYIADIIYGVTMGDDSISKLLSIKID